jgi:hypothetical protein
VDIGEQAHALLRSMGGRLFGRLEGDAPFLLDSGWSGPVPHHLAGELHEAGFIEIDETAPVGDTYVFRISQAGAAYLNSNPGPSKTEEDPPRSIGVRAPS